MSGPDRGLVIFDLDGTLLDTPAANVATIAAAFEAIGAPAPDPAAARATVGLPLEVAFGQLLGVAADDGLVVRGMRRYRTLFDERVLPAAADLVLPGVGGGLAALHHQGFVLAVATSRLQAGAEALLRAAGLRSWFGLVIGADQVARPKPDPEPVQLILRRLGIAAGRALMVGDTTHDLRMARAAGVRSIAVSYGAHPARELAAAAPTWLADTFEEVQALVEAGLRPAGESG